MISAVVNTVSDISQSLNLKPVASSVWYLYTVRDVKRYEIFGANKVYCAASKQIP